MVEAKSHSKILMTADTVGGVWTYCMDLCKALQPFGAAVHLVTMGAKMNDWQVREVKALPNVKVYETDYKLEWMQDSWDDLKRCGDWLLALERELQPDIVHLNCFAYGSLPFNAPMMVVAHSDVWSWFLSVKGHPPTEEWNRYFSFVQSGILGAGQVIAPSEAKLQSIKKIYGVSDGAVVFNGRNRSLFCAAQKQRSVFSMGRIWDEAKNINLLVQAAPAIQSPVRIAGENSFAQNSFAGDNSSVKLLGKLSTEEIAAELATAAVYVLPAKYEPFGLSALEAAFSGCALVLGDIPSLREIWEDAAVYVDPCSAEELANAVNNLLDDERGLTQWSKKAAQRAMHFTAGKMAHRYWQFYQQMIKEKTVLQTQETR